MLLGLDSRDPGPDKPVRLHSLPPHLRLLRIDHLRRKMQLRHRQVRPTSIRTRTRWTSARNRWRWECESVEGMGRAVRSRAGELAGILAVLDRQLRADTRYVPLRLFIRVETDEMRAVYD